MREEIDPDSRRGRLAVKIHSLLREWEQTDRRQLQADARAQNLTLTQLLAACLTEAVIEVVGEG